MYIYVNLFNIRTKIAPKTLFYVKLAQKRGKGSKIV